MGQSYLLGCPEGGESRLLDAVGRVDGAMCQIRDAGKVKARDRIAVLAALNLAFQLNDQPAAPARAADAGDGAGKGTAARPDDGPLDERLAGLIQRLDSALSEDGRLL